MAKPNIIMWFRQDLRLHDNPALCHATEYGNIIPIYILDDANSGDRNLGAASRWWLHHSLQSLNKSLKGRLLLFKGDPHQIIEKLVDKLSVEKVVWNRCYQKWQIERDSKIKKSLSEADIEVKSFNGSLLWEPMRVCKKDGKPYRVFTPYYRKGCLQLDEPSTPMAKPKPIRILEKNEGASLKSLNLMPDIKWYDGIDEEWAPGEDGAKIRLDTFLEEALDGYKEKRNVPKHPGTSRLSPHLHFGEISPNQVWHAVVAKKAGRKDGEDTDTFLSELGWREFSYYLLFHFPDITHSNFQEKFNKLSWSRSKKNLQAWQKGLTGIPIVDAGMRELWQTGYMHNRVRMIVGSFLVKNLRIHWHEGERWFWDCLVDADPASNCASWQWVAGTGADAAPYFRIFNPVTQGEKFDTKGEYVKKYCPELSDMPDKFLHQPWNADQDILKAANITLGEDYPKPIVDLKESRADALEAFKALKAG